MKKIHVISIVTLIGIVLAVWIPSLPSKDNIGKFQIQEATSLLKKLSVEVEMFHEEYNHTPNVNELVGLETSGEYVASLSGSNPYFANIKSEAVYEGIAGKSLGWKYDPESGIWEKCSAGSVPLHFRSIECRRR
jgi:hypothetical protein